MGVERGFHDWGNVYLENSDISYLVYSIFSLAYEKYEVCHSKIVVLRLCLNPFLCPKYVATYFGHRNGFKHMLKTTILP